MMMPGGDGWDGPIGSHHYIEQIPIEDALRDGERRILFTGPRRYVLMETFFYQLSVEYSGLSHSTNREILNYNLDRENRA